ncbi:hypothetical protein [Meiothermus sp. CFH 77666]|uniref:hypothetical protein n=1 Tax=Meiothermus sp. CFH 77666 TaxID=2817942 RepID=UPI001AA04BD4|nr:hypothetical protein [Meiothermus sp. CFH 77666]MBO1438408.1 hypothetical protein [Meiothermus sp. CFH 77666]
MDLEAMWAAGRHREGLNWCLERLSYSPDGLYARYALEFAIELEDEPALAQLLHSAHPSPEFQALKSLLWWQRAWSPETLEMAQQAYQEQPGFLTAYALGTTAALRSFQEAEGWLKEALRHAEEAGQPHRSVQAAAALALLQMGLGAYTQARTWAEWGLDLAKHIGMRHPGVQNTLWLAWGYAQALSGRLPSLPAIDLAQPDAALAQGDFLLALGNPEAALQAYATLERKLAPVRARRLPIIVRKVRALLELERLEEALQVGREAHTLSEGTADFFRDLGDLAYLMPTALVAPSEAVTSLHGLLERLTQRRNTPRSAMAALYLARAYLGLGMEARAQEVLRSARQTLGGLSPAGRAFLAGPAHHFQEVFALLQPVPSLRLHFLGTPTVWANSQRLKLSPRHLEITTALAVNPGGLDAERLALWVWGDAGKPEVARAEIQRLRRKLALLSHPYRLDGTVWADFLEAREILLQGNLSEALALYGGPLLPGSEAPGVVELREELWNLVVHALDRHGTPEQIYEMALKENDPVLWQMASERLPQADPRLALMQARLRRFLGAD